MSATLTEVLMAVGSFSIDFDYDPELFDELTDGRGVLIYWGEDLIYGGIKLGDNPGLDGITITGAAPEWLLGSDDIGPTLEDKTYVAGNNKLSNPAFVYLHDEAAKALDGSDTIRQTADNWKLADQTGWVISEGQAISTQNLYVGLDTSDPTFILPGDILTSDESFETLAGDQWRATVTAQRLFGAVGFLRLRLVFDGYFQHPNLLPTLASWTVHDVGGDAAISGTNIRIGPNTQPQYVTDPSFENGLADWVVGGDPDWSAISTLSTSYGTLSPRTGSLMVEVFVGSGAATPPDRYLGPLSGPGVLPGERYRLSGFVVERSFTRGTASLLIAANNLVTFPDNIQSLPLVASNFQNSAAPSFALQWRNLQVEYTIPDGVVGILPYIYVSFAVQDDGTLWGTGFIFDDITLTRVGGNFSRVTSPTITIVPEESYDLEALVTADAGVTDGTLGFSLLFQGPDRPDQVIDGASTDNSATTPTKLLSPFASPSGYDKVTISVVGTDILGGGFSCSTPTLRLSDPKRSVADVTSGSALGDADATLTTTAPTGTEHVHLELIADDKGDGYDVRSASLERAETPWTSGAVVRDLLTDPLTADSLLIAGNVVGSELITFDWHVRNLTRRAQLQHLSRSGLAEPEREWRIYVDPVTQQPTIDWGTPEAIFSDRTDLVFIEDDLKVIGVPSKEHTADARVTRVKVVGADRQRPNGPPIQISGVATNTAPEFVDWFGNPLNRTQTVADSSADHPDYAAGLAEYKASLAASPAENVRMSISDWQQWADKGPFHVGDWVYVYKPDAGIEDATNQMTVDGRTVWPKKLRVISRTWHLGGGFRLEVHRPGQTNYVPEDDLIRWESDTTAELELGDPLPEFSADSEGDTAFNQFKRFRASMPR